MRKKIKKGFEKIEKKKDVEAYGEHVVVVVAEDGVVEGDVVEVVLLVGEAVVHHIDRRYHQGGWRVVVVGFEERRVRVRKRIAICDAMDGTECVRV